MRTTNPRHINFTKKFDLSGKVIIITGACGLIGRAFAEACAQFGAHVVLADVAATNPQEESRQLQRKYKRKMLGIPVNVDDRASVEYLKEQVLDTYKVIHGLVNAHQNKTQNFFQCFEEYEEENWDAVVRTNLKGVFFTCQIIGGWMASHGGGSIVNIPSTYSVVAPNHRLYEGTHLGCPAAYVASKGGVVALSRYLAAYWADKKVRVNMLTPHGVWNEHEKKFEENFAQFSPLKRMSYNHEVAPGLIFLLSDASSYVTGHNLMIDGGWTAW